MADSSVSGTWGLIILLIFFAAVGAVAGDAALAGCQPAGSDPGYQQMQPADQEDIDGEGY